MRILDKLIDWSMGIAIVVALLVWSLCLVFLAILTILMISELL
jgi:hypothetical protein